MAAAAIERAVDGFAPPVEAAVHAVTARVQPVGRDVATVPLCAIRGTVQTVVDAVTAPIQPLFDPVPARIEPAFDSVPAPVGASRRVLRKDLRRARE